MDAGLSEVLKSQATEVIEVPTTGKAEVAVSVAASSFLSRDLLKKRPNSYGPGERTVASTSANNSPLGQTHNADETPDSTIGSPNVSRIGSYNKDSVRRRNTVAVSSADAGGLSELRRSPSNPSQPEMRKESGSNHLAKKISFRRKKDKEPPATEDEDDTVLVGTKVDKHHVNYVQMYDMLTGIRVAVSRCEAKPQRELEDEDFSAAHKLAFDM